MRGTPTRSMASRKARSAAAARKKPKTGKARDEQNRGNQAPVQKQAEPEGCVRMRASGIDEEGTAQRSDASATSCGPAPRSTAGPAASEKPVASERRPCSCAFDIIISRCSFCSKTNPSRVLFDNTVSKLFETVTATEVLIGDDGLLAWMKAHGFSFDLKSALRTAMRIHNFDLFAFLFQTYGEHTFPKTSPRALNDFFDDTIGRLIGYRRGLNAPLDLQKIEKFLTFMIDHGARAERKNIEALICKYSWSNDIESDAAKRLMHFLKNVGGVCPDTSHAEVALLTGNVRALQYLHDEFDVPFQPYFVHMACENVDIKAVTFLIDEADVTHNVDELLRSLHEAWEHSDMLADRRYDDPVNLERKYRELRRYLRAKKGWSPERDRQRLRTILELFDLHKEEFQTCVYVDLMQYLKRLHDDTKEA